MTSQPNININIKADIAVFPVGAVYYGKKIIYENITGSGILKKTSNTLPSSYNTSQIENDYIDMSLESTVITQPRQLAYFILHPDFKITDYPNLNTLILIANLTGTYYNDNDPTKYYFFYEIEYHYAEGIISKRNENYSNTQPHLIKKLYNLYITLKENTSFEFNIVNNSNNMVSWHLKLRFK